MPIPTTLTGIKGELNAIYDAAVAKKNAEVQAIAMGAYAQVLAVESVVASATDITEMASDIHEMALDVVKHPAP